VSIRPYAHLFLFECGLRQRILFFLQCFLPVLFFTGGFGFLVWLFSCLVSGVLWREGEMDDGIRKDGDRYMYPWRNQQYGWAQTTLFSLSRVKLHVWYVCT